MDFVTQKGTKFGDVVVNVWQHGLMGVDIGRILIAIGIFVIFFALREPFTKVCTGLLRKWASKTATNTDDIIVEAAEEPIRFLPIVLGVFFACEFMQPVGRFETFTNNLVTSLITFTIFWTLTRLVEPFRFLLKRLEVVFSPMAVAWLIRGIKILLILVGTATILEMWGIKVAPLIAGLGLFGVAVALGAQDMFKNLIGGLLVIGEKRFNLGDWIKVEGVVEGTVEDIGFRSTMIRRFDKAPVYVPNSQLADKAVTNFSAMTHRRIYWNIKIPKTVSFEELHKIRERIEQYILTSDEFANPSEATTAVRISSFGDESVGLMVYCFTRATEWTEWLKVKERLAQKVRDILNESGAGFSVGSETPEFEVGSDAAEVFVPPSDEDDAKEKKAESEKSDEQKLIQDKLKAAADEQKMLQEKLNALQAEEKEILASQQKNVDSDSFNPPSTNFSSADSKTR